MDYDTRFWTAPDGRRLFTVSKDGMHVDVLADTAESLTSEQLYERIVAPALATICRSGTVKIG